MRRLVLTASVALAAAVAAPALASGGSNRVAGDCTSSQARPKRITLTCADAYTYLSSIRWKSFGGASARGSGRFDYNPCTPNCAAGKEHAARASFVLSRAKPCQDNVSDYRHIVVTFSGTPPSGYTRRYATKLFCPIG